ncbi:MAG: acyltransferase [Gammaproteobacteria bacterium]|nr:acyltransferase [Gammaproteobacteria bacterium]
MHHYRADIDGLRAVAIVPVVLFHAGASFFSGGFVGVDVFFVISGFLITGLIRHEIDTGRFSLVNFYERRVRRLLPALFAMLLVVTVLAAWLLLPADLADYAKSVLATSLFASNFLFWQEAGYFGRAAEEMPLLHTWSLAVEEQFYILFPLFLTFIAGRTRKPYVAATALVTAVSFALCAVAVAVERDAAFYLAPARAWELGLGALLAMGAIPVAHRRLVRSVVGLLGLGALLCSVTLYTPATVFPGVTALLPCLGTAAIIWAGSGGHNVVGDALSARPVVLTGLVSYSLYLWHWPLLTLGRYYAIRDLTVLETALLLTLAAVAAVASWRYVERPFRGKSGLLERRLLFTAAATLMGVAVVASTAAIVAEGWPARSDPAVRRIIDGGNDRRTRNWECGNTSMAKVRSGDLCRTGSPQAGAPTFIVWGDSHARAMADAIGAAAAHADGVGLLALRSGCAPLRDAEVAGQDAEHDCSAFTEGVLGLTARSPGVTDVVLAGRWALLAEGTRYGHESGEPVILTDSHSRERSLANNQQVFARALRGSVTALLAQGKRVWLVASVPEVGWDVPSVLARSHRFGRMPPDAPTRAEYAARQEHVLAVLEELDALPGVVVLRPDAVLCREVRCAVTRDGLPLYFDSHHLTLRGGSLLEPLFAQIFKR